LKTNRKKATDKSHKDVGPAGARGCDVEPAGDMSLSPVRRPAGRQAGVNDADPQAFIQTPYVWGMERAGIGGFLWTMCLQRGLGVEPLVRESGR